MRNAGGEWRIWRIYRAGFALAAPGYPERMDDERTSGREERREPPEADAGSREPREPGAPDAVPREPGREPRDAEEPGETPEPEEDVGLYAPRDRYTRDIDPDAPPPPVPPTGSDREPPEPPAGADTAGPPAGS